VLLLDKPLGLSSNQALQKAKWLLRAEKAGIPARSIRSRAACCLVFRGGHEIQPTFSGRRQGLGLAPPG
jgi:hypothetical protein